MEVLDIQPIFIKSAHAQDTHILCGFCRNSFSPASTGANICLTCLTAQTDITNGLPRQAVLNYCRTCECYQGRRWIRAELGSKDLLALCLRKIKGLSKLRLVDACFVWTEPHSKRIKAKVTVQKTVLQGVTVQESFVVEYTVQNLQCEECKKDYISDMWGSLVQIRQRAQHKKAVFFLEQLVLKNNAHEKVLKIKDVNDGVDFYYKEKGDAMKLVDFLQSVLPIKVKQSKQLISQENVNSVNNYKYVLSLDLPKICKDDMVILSPKLAAALGDCSPVLICSKLGTTVQFIDPVNVKFIELTSLQYFQSEDEMTVVPAKHCLTEFIVFESESHGSPRENVFSSNLKVVRAMINRKYDWKEFEVRSFLGDSLKEGTSVLGYDLTTLNFNAFVGDTSFFTALPEVILIKRSYFETKNGSRIWKLKHLDKEELYATEEQLAVDYEDFLNDLETDQEMRLHINLYRNEKAIRDKENKMEDEHTRDNFNKKQSKKRLKVKRRSRKSPLVALGGQDRDDRDQDDNRDDDTGDEKKSDDMEDKEKEDKEDEEEDPMIKIEELLADLSLEDEEMEDEDAAIEEFIRRLERVRIEGKE